MGQQVGSMIPFVVGTWSVGGKNLTVYLSSTALLSVRFGWVFLEGDQRERQSSGLCHTTILNPARCDRSGGPHRYFKIFNLFGLPVSSRLARTTWTRRTFWGRPRSSGESKVFLANPLRYETGKGPLEPIQGCKKASLVLLTWDWQPARASLRVVTC